MSEKVLDKGQIRSIPEGKRLIRGTIAFVAIIEDSKDYFPELCGDITVNVSNIEDIATFEVYLENPWADSKDELFVTVDKNPNIDTENARDKEDSL